MPISLYDRAKLFINGYQDYLSMGKCYAEGIIVEKNIQLAFECYELGILDAQIECYASRGELYEKNGQIDLAIQEYAAGYKRGCQEAHRELEELANINVVAAFRLAKLYEKKQLWRYAEKVYMHIYTNNNMDEHRWVALHHLGLLYLTDKINILKEIEINRNIHLAINYLLTAALHASPEALQLLINMASNQKEAAYTLGLYYECGGHTKTISLNDAFTYYLKAAYLDHDDVINRMENIASKSIHISQFFDLIKFFCEKKMFDSCKTFYISNVHKYKGEIQTYNIRLRNHIWHLLGTWEDKNGGDIPLTIHLFKQCGDRYSNALLRIAELILQQDSENKIGAWPYLYRATRLYSQNSEVAKSALAMMESIAEDMPSNEQIQLARLYETKEYINLDAANAWYKEAALAGNQEAERYLNKAKKPNSRDTHSLFSYKLLPSKRNDSTIEQWLSM